MAIAYTAAGDLPPWSGFLNRLLRQFIFDVIEHVASQATQDERARFWVREAYSGQYQTVRQAPVVPFLSRPPADTPVLLGHVKDPEHLAWIHATRLYNLRADKRRGSVGLGSQELAAEFVVLHGRTLETPELWQVIGEPRLCTRDQLASMHYPSPHGELYYCFQIAEVPAGPWTAFIAGAKILALLRRSRRRRGEPVTTTWLELLR